MDVATGNLRVSTRSLSLVGVTGQVGIGQISTSPGGPTAAAGCATGAVLGFISGGISGFVGSIVTQSIS